MRAERIETGERVTGQFNSRQDPANIYRYDDPSPRLPGGWYLFEQRLPVPGCWRLSAAIDGRVVGTALIEVGGGARPPAAGTYMTARTIEGHPCFAFAITASRYERATDLHGLVVGRERRRQLPEATRRCRDDRGHDPAAGRVAL